MLQQLKRLWSLQKRDYAIYVPVVLGLYLFGVMLLSLILRFSEEETTYFYLGTIMGLGGVALVIFLKHGFIGNIQFQLAISMQQTRRQYLAADLLYSMLELAAGYVLMRGLYQVEIGLYHWLFPQYTLEVSFDLVFQWRFIFPVAAGVLILSQFCSAIYGRFGMKGFLGLYFGFMLVMIGVPRLVALLPQLQNGAIGAWVASVFAATPITVWIALGAALLGVLLWISIRMLLKQSVKL